MLVHKNCRFDSNDSHVALQIVFSHTQANIIWLQTHTSSVEHRRKWRVGSKLMVTKLNRHHHRKNSRMYSESPHQYISTRETTIKREMYSQVPSRKFEITAIISTITCINIRKEKRIKDPRVSHRMWPHRLSKTDKKEERRKEDKHYLKASEKICCFG